MNSMTPSNTTTAGQIDKAVANYRALLEKYAKEFNSESVQTVLGQAELADEQFAIFRKRVDAISVMIMRTVKVNRNQSPIEMLNATGRSQYTDNDVVATMPKGEGEETEVYFFKIGRFVSDDDLEKEYELRGLKPADPYSQAKANQDDPALADTHPNGTHWKDAKANWCFSAFDRRSDGRYVGVSRSGSEWGVFWWFAGARK